ncbi:hypothetical protein [Brevundimonas intermedia]|uniref:hypothetical protein n=1 Tax=Brevundimonas intermedia TaxID=74315 RepID=UPI00320911AE
MPKPIDHPNDSGKWTLLETKSSAALWRRERSDPVPVTQFYLLAPPRQAQVLYDEARARQEFAILASDDRIQAA